MPVVLVAEITTLSLVTLIALINAVFFCFVYVNSDVGFRVRHLKSVAVKTEFLLVASVTSPYIAPVGVSGMKAHPIFRVRQDHSILLDHDMAGSAVRYIVAVRAGFQWVSAVAL